MPKFTPNPQAEVDAGFDVVAPGTYRMRVEGSVNLAGIQEFVATSGNTCIKLRAVFADRSSLTKLDGSPAKNPGSIIDSSIVMLPKEKQGKLRSVWESCGKDWGVAGQELDADELLGCEFEALISIEEYKGENKNVIKRYLVPKQ